MCIGSSAWGGSGKTPRRAPPHPSTALPRQCYEHTLLNKNSHWILFGLSLMDITEQKALMAVAIQLLDSVET